MWAPGGRCLVQSWALPASPEAEGIVSLHTCGLCETLISVLLWGLPPTSLPSLHPRGTTLSPAPPLQQLSLQWFVQWRLVGVATLLGAVLKYRIRSTKSEVQDTQHQIWVQDTQHRNLSTGSRSTKSGAAQGRRRCNL